MIGEFFFFLFSGFLIVGAIGGWVVIVLLLARERSFTRADIERATREAETHPNVGRKADARLIAAAPELYEACKRASDELKLSREYGLYDDETRALVAALDAALSKATGKDEE